MDRTTLAGVGLTAASVVGYGVGIAGDLGYVPVVEGRAFAVTGLMVGITLWALGGGATGDGADPEADAAPVGGRNADDTDAVGGDGTGDGAAGGDRP